MKAPSSKREIVVQKDWCPNCDYGLEVHELGATYAIVDNGHAVTCCPGCMRPLIVEDGKLVEDAAISG